MKKWRKENKEKKALSDKLYQERNKEKLKEYYKKYREKNKSKILLKSRVRYKNNKIEYNKKIKEYCKLNKSKIAERKKEYVKRNHEKVLAQYLVQRDKKKTPNLYSDECMICGTKENIEQHHPLYSFPYLVYPLCRKHHAQIHWVSEV